MINPWTPERVRRLTELWLSGCTRAEVARVLGAPITESSVKGKVRRLGLRREALPAAARKAAALTPPGASPAPEGRKAASAKDVSSRHRSSAQPEPGMPEGGPAPEAGGTGARPEAVSAVVRAAVRRVANSGRGAGDGRERVFRFPEYNECHWPHGEPDNPDFDFCLAPVSPGKSYCEEHAEQAYRKKGS